jgi:hypothetical protein
MSGKVIVVNANYEETLYKVKFWIRTRERFLHYQQHLFRNVVEVDLVSGSIEQYLLGCHSFYP